MLALMCPFHGPPSPWGHQWQLPAAQNLDFCLLAQSSIKGGAAIRDVLPGNMLAGWEPDIPQGAPLSA